MFYVRFPLSLRNVEDLLHERGINVSHESVQADAKSTEFVAVHSSVHNHFNQQRHLYSNQNFKLNRNAAFNEWRQLCAA